jgi:signal transduction histidine kinase
MGLERGLLLGRSLENVGAHASHYMWIPYALASIGPASRKRGSEIELSARVRRRTHSYLIKATDLKWREQSLGTLLVFQDVTYLRDKDRARTTLFATLSQEFRAALASMIMATQLLQHEAALSQAQKQLLEMILEETERMRQLSDELLSLAREEGPSITTSSAARSITGLLSDSSLTPGSSGGNA